MTKPNFTILIFLQTFIFFIVLNSALFSQTDIKAFYIGHSLSDQISEMVSSLASDDPDVEYDWRYQTIPGSPLRWNWEAQERDDYNPIPPHLYGYYHPSEGLPAGDFDVFVLTESVPRTWGPWGIEDTYVYADSFYLYFDQHNPNQQLYLYEVWHCINSGLPAGCMYDPNDQIPWRQRLDDDLPMWTSVLDEINTNRNPTLPMLMIPGGQGLARLTDSIDAGAIPGINEIADLFSDDIHLTDQGKYFIACIHFATLFHKSPEGLTNQLFNTWGVPFNPPTSAQAEIFQQIAWEVVVDFGHLTGVVIDEPIANISADPTSGTAPLEVNFDGSDSDDPANGGLTYEWDFGDGSDIEEGETVTHTYTEPGTYTAILTITDINDNTDSEEVEIQVNLPGGPIAVIDADPTSGTVPLTVNFDGSNSENFAAGDLSYEWDFGDGSNLQTGETVSHTYTEVGSYSATLTVTDIHGSQHSAQTTIQVNLPGGPIAVIDADPTSGTVPLTVNFDGSNSENFATGDLSYEWDFGDGSDIETGETASHTYTETGSFTATLTVMDIHGSQHSAQTTIQVDLPPEPVAVIDANPTLGTVPLTVNFDGSNSENFAAGDLSYEWNFGDGSDTETGETVTHTYTEVGSYSATLTVTDIHGSQSSAEVNIQVNQAQRPVAVITANPMAGIVPLNVEFDGSMSVDPSAEGLSYLWDFGDGSPESNQEITSHTFINAGTFEVSLTVTDNQGNSDMTSIEIEAMQETLNAILTATNSLGFAPLNVQFDARQTVYNGSEDLTYFWDFGDGTSYEGGAIESHLYTEGGMVYLAKVTVSSANSSSTDSVLVTVQNQPDQDACQFLAYEGFDYLLGSSLHGLNEGQGWADSWRVQNANNTVPGYQISQIQESLEYQDIQSSGSHATGGLEFLTAGRALNTAPDGPFTSYVNEWEPYIGSVKSGDSLWVSVLLRKEIDTPEHLYIDLTNSNIPECNSIQWCSDNRIGLGYFGGDSEVDGVAMWSLRIGEEVYNSGVPMVAGETALLVALLVFDETATGVSLFVNPPELGFNGPQKTADVEAFTPEPYLIRSLAFFAGAQPGYGSIDEIRMAKSYACVTPDSDVVIELPPVAIIEAGPNLSGQAPLTVNFDGTQSYDPQGGSLTYVWDFGDGSDRAFSSTATHTYDLSGGQLEATLTVFSESGLQSSASVIVTLYNDDNTFPCEGTVSNFSMADCSGSGGHIGVNTAHDVNFELLQNGMQITPSNGNEYENLDVGLYQLVFSGDNGCYQEFDIHILVDSTTCEGWQPTHCAMPLGTNINSMADWATHRPFRNFMKNTRGEPIPYTNECNCWSFDNPGAILEEMTFDENGYPLYLPQSTSEGSTLLRFFVSASGANMMPGNSYLLLYQGEGEILLSGSIENTEYQQGRVSFDLEGDGTFWFQILESTMGDHIRNIRVVRPEDEFADLENEPFYSVFLDKLAPFSNLRFMDWTRTNNNPIVHWEDRILPDFYTYGVETGAPYETVIQLANQTGKDIWICVPHSANDEYIENMATLFKESLNEDIVIYLEYSNEVWNWIFDQSHYNIDNNPFELNFGRAYAEKARNVFNIWHDVFEGEECRVKRVLGIQLSNHFVNESILIHLNQDDWDYGSPTHYFGLDHSETGNPRLDLLGENTTVEDIIANALDNFERSIPYFKRDFATIQMLGKEVITYEGGQHFVGNVFGIPYDYQQAMWDAQNTSEMYELYQMALDSIRAWGCKLASNFSLAGPQESIFGSWGVMDHIDVEDPYFETAPKYQVHIDNQVSASCLEEIRIQDLDCIDDTTPIFELPETEKGAFKVYPNPGNNHIYFIFEGDEGKVKLYDITGKLLKTTDQKQMDTSDLVPGMYLIRWNGMVVRWIKHF